ncbi:unnamed protein product [Larinioides sclopetarius]|uniref:Uncharacterized protein n=1 Tax=Larinioides sclopetarius TaxID=280406 RepID=A0AAV2AK75_9ARAC
MTDMKSSQGSCDTEFRILYRFKSGIYGMLDRSVHHCTRQQAGVRTCLKMDVHVKTPSIESVVFNHVVPMANSFCKQMFKGKADLICWAVLSCMDSAMDTQSISQLSKMKGHSISNKLH